MPLIPGSKLGPYEILAPLGAGGMGEVYRAKDTRLGRDVAIKVLPEHLSTEPEVRARFEREAKTISSLNHPHICTLFDVGREGETDFLVMELVEGETLAARLERGALPTSEVLRLGAQIADALDRAHRAGIVHRDLKPANVMLTKSGAKLMDFGLARAAGLSGAGGGTSVTLAALSQSPTMSRPLTVAGSIVGTFQYMSPEQLEGRDADARGDIWALGCVLYEMATGHRAFEGTSQASLITAIMSAQPAPVSQLVPTNPPALDRLVQACLMKESAERIQSAHDVKLQLSWLAEGGSQTNVPAPGVALPAKASRGRERIAWAVAAVAFLIAAATPFLAKHPAPIAPAVHAALQPPPGVLFSSSTDTPLPLAISPDGSVIAFCARSGEGPDLLWVRSLDKLDAHSLAGTEGAEGPFFSPDGRSLGFFADGKLKRVDVAGGPVISLADQIDARGGTWNQDGVILFGRGTTGPVSMIAADGGVETHATVLDSANGEVTHRYPHFLPDGRHFLYLARRAGAGAGTSPIIYAGELGSRERKRVLEVASNVAFASGHLIYVRETVLVAQPFDLGSLKVTGSAAPLVDEVRMDGRYSRGVFALSQNGVLVCMTGNNQTRTQLRWLDRAGRPTGDVGEPADYTYGGVPSVSPDGESAVLPIHNPDRGSSDVWLVELGSGRRRKLTVDTSDHPAACWLPDGRSVIIGTNARGDAGIDIVSIEGTSSRRILSSPGEYPWPRSAHGDRLLYEPTAGAGVNEDMGIHTISLSGSGTSEPFAVTSGDATRPQWSPDGRWVAYESNETGKSEIFVATFPQPGGRWQVSQGGGTEACWSRDGRELFYFDPENYLISVVVDHSTSGFQPGASKKLFQFHGSGAKNRYDVAPDGDRFLVTAPLEKDLASPVTLITDWPRKMLNH
ncbi:MAG: protein kinase domain-containing protein [bacterium]